MNHKLYLSDPGIRHQGSSFYYNKTDSRVTDVALLERVSKIKVPPAWKNVWYASNKKCHIQVYGIDASGKKQYILSNEWVNNAKSEKFTRMKSFIRNLGPFKKKIKLTNNKLTKDNIIKLLFNLLIDIHIRVGNEIYAEQNKTYGLTTLLQKHLILTGSVYSLSFIGKSKIKHSLDIPTEYQSIIKKLILPNKNKSLFHYQNDSLEHKIVSSEELNIYLKENMGSSYTCKDFRTYSANILFIKAFLYNSKKESNVKKVVLKSIDSSAKQLGHTRSISKKSYISDNLLNYCIDSFTTASSLSSGVLLSKVWS